MVRHLFHSDWQGIFIAEHNLGQRIADQDHVYAGFVHQAGSGVIISGEAGDQLLLLFLFLNSVGGDLSACGAGAAIAERSDAHIASSAVRGARYHLLPH